jgi:hypothetical protein
VQHLRIPTLLLIGMLGGCKAPGATLTRLLSINDSGQIVPPGLHTGCTLAAKAMCGAWHGLQIGRRNR